MRRDGADIGADNARFHRMFVQLRQGVARGPRRLAVQRLGAQVTGPQQTPGSAGKIGKRVPAEKPRVAPLHGLFGPDNERRQHLRRRRLGVKRRRFLPVMYDALEELARDVHVMADAGAGNGPDGLRERGQNAVYPIRVAIPQRPQEFYRRLENGAPIGLENLFPGADNALETKTARIGKR